MSTDGGHMWNLPGVSAACAILLFAVSAACQQKEVVEEFVTTTYSGPPATLAGMREGAAAVVLARYDGQRSLVEHTNPSHVVTYRGTRYKLVVTEVLKPNVLLPALGEPVEIELPGGERETDTHRYRTVPIGVEPLVSGSTYLVFLGWNHVANELRLAWGVLALCQVSGVVVRAVRRSNALHDGRSLDDMRGELTGSR